MKIHGKGKKIDTLEECRNVAKGRNVEGQDHLEGLSKGTKVQISAKSHEVKYRRRSLEVVSLGRAQNNHDVRLTISLS